MKRYRVKNKCSGFKRRTWDAGRLVDLEDNEIPPHHFELVQENCDGEYKLVTVTDNFYRPEPTNSDAIAYSQVKASPRIATGMAAGLEK